ncbi:hypothetical protein M413DRAFT_33089 [Hebeloma cylindrosporum]|uniref:Xylanolytic transcriptional activator regulatory domain-containing protein n=1 Tax=Hebeloma cylindrosporum TaxID=76867 RepID=A0A0C2X9K0_HEBCY|nr:hypothetical protein M413DRAFT_33089 [Hebeloma cylindrosporum h7]
MSSDEGEFNDRDASSTLMKKRKTQRACDFDVSEGVPIPGNRCPNCRSLGVDCTYIEAAKKRGPLKPYVKRLENRINNIDKLLRELCADEMHYKELTATIDGTWTEPPPVDPSILFSDTATEAQPNTVKLDNITSIIRYSMKSGVDARSSGDADDPTLNLADQLKRVSIVQHNRFLGKSSQAMLIRMAMEMKKEYMGEVGEVGDPGKPMMKNARPEFLGVSPWEQTINETVSMQYIFPDFDLALHCIDLYFKYSNLYLPLLHRPTFDKYVKEGLHLTDGDFAPVFLLVCAVGARYSDNPRVRLDGVDSHHSAGWKWFEQVQITKRSLLTPASLCDLQLYCLCIQYLQGSSAAQSCWTLAGIGIRLAHDVGAHRRKEHNHKLTPNDELWKRAFWVLMRNLPVDCDDEYWDNADPEKCFKQPPNKPSLITAFILYLKLHQILAFSLRTIYSVDRSKILLGFVGQHWEQHIVAELDSALNKWVDLVPDHLRWDPNRKDGNFFNQSVSLYATYYSVQISIHRTFIPSPTKPSPLPFPSLTICTNAARSCSHVIYIQRKRNSNPPPHIQTPIFTTGIVLLLGILTSKRSGLPMDRSQVGGVQTCMDVLKSSEARWHSAGILWSILYKFAVKVELPFPQPSPPATTRGASEPDGLSSTAIDSSFYPISQNEIRTLINDQQSGHAFVGQAQRVPLPPSERLPHPPIGEASLRSHSDSQIGHGLESRQSPFSISSSIVDAELPVYLTASYSNDLATNAAAAAFSSSFPDKPLASRAIRAHAPSSSQRGKLLLASPPAPISPSAAAAALRQSSCPGEHSSGQDLPYVKIKLVAGCVRNAAYGDGNGVR